MNLVFDASPLIYLGKVRILEHIGSFSKKNIIPNSIYKEVVQQGKVLGFEDANYIEHLVEKRVFEVVKVASILASLEGSSIIHDGEKEVLSIAQQMSYTAVVDDKDARSVASIEDIDVVGSVFILFRLLKLGKLSKKEVKQHIDRMIKDGWRCSTELYAYVLDYLK